MRRRRRTISRSLRPIMGSRWPVSTLILYRPQTQALLIDFPTSFAKPDATARPSTHRIAIDENRNVSIDGTGVPDTFVPEALAHLRSLREAPRIQFTPDGRLSYGRAVQILSLIQISGGWLIARSFSRSFPVTGASTKAGE